MGKKNKERNKPWDYVCYLRDDAQITFRSVLFVSSYSPSVDKIIPNIIIEIIALRKNTVAAAAEDICFIRMLVSKFDEQSRLKSKIDFQVNR